MIHSTRVHLLLLFALTFLTFSNSFENAFQLDDFHVITDNPEIRVTSPWWRHFTDASTMSTLPTNRSYRPLLPLTLSWSYAAHDLNVVGYHVFNLLVHLATVIVFYFCFSHALAIAKIPLSIAFTAAALFAVHPIAGMSVNYLSSRDNLLMQLFLAITLLAYFLHREQKTHSRLWAIAAPLTFLLALFSKDAALVFPAIIFLSEIVIRKDRLNQLKPWLWAGPLLLLALLFLWLSALVPNHSLQLVGIGNWKQMFIFAATQIKIHTFYYLKNFVWPLEARGLPRWEVFSGFGDLYFWVGLGVLSGSLYGAWKLRHRASTISWAILSYWVLFVPTSSFFPLAQWAADRWMYPSLPFLCLVAAWGLYKMVRPNLYAAFSLLLILTFAGTSFYMNRHWATPRAFLEQSYRYGTDAIGTMNLGREYLSIDPKKARTLYEESLTMAPRYHYAHINLGLLRIAQGETKDGLEQVKLGASYAPAGLHASVLYWVGIAEQRAGQYREAAETLLQAARAEPTQLEKLFEAAYAAHLAGHPKESLALFDELHEKIPNVKISRFTAGWVAWQNGNVDRAIAEYQLAIKYTPTYAQTYFNLGFALKKMGRCPEALSHFETYAQLTGDQTGVRLHLEDCRKHPGTPASK